MDERIGQLEKDRRPDRIERVIEVSLAHRVCAPAVNSL
jgi:hypothetical protein